MNALAGMVLDLLLGVLMKAGYMRTQNAFPQPLSRDEEARQLQLLAEGDGEQRSKAFDILVERNLRLVAHVVKKFSDTGEDVEDLISIGTIGLIKGIQTFDPSRGTRLATYAARCVENEILMSPPCGTIWKRDLTAECPPA